MLCSATADSKTQTIAKQYLKTNFSFFNLNSHDSENKDASGVPIKLNHYYMLLPIENKMDTLFSFLRAHTTSKCIVFF